ncbi:MAG: DUF4160 domain-containing protein [Lachnospiraceae bacterium]|jgi:hypothetical protein|nr:DUF4160 domain-containing protein [Lachnospiraceae bacterium]
MPALYKFLGYSIYFYSNENDEPIHVHISKGKPSLNSTKIWLLKNGGVKLANNKSKLSVRELNKMYSFIIMNYEEICNEWKQFYGFIKYND